MTETTTALWTTLCSVGKFTHRVPHTTQWVFCPSGSNAAFPVICGFEPIPEIVEYTIEHTKPQGNFIAALRSVVKITRSPWSRQLAQALSLPVKLYVQGETFADLVTKAVYVDFSQPCLLWMYWDRVRYICHVQGVHLMDTVKIHSITDKVHRLFSNADNRHTYKEMIDSLACDPYAYVYADTLVGVSSDTVYMFTLIQDMKDWMKREQRWEVPLAALKRLPCRLNQQICKVDPARFPVKYNPQTQMLTFIPQFEDDGDLRDDEPVDALADQMIKWTRPPSTLYADVTYHMVSAITSIQRRTVTRLQIAQTPGGPPIDVWNHIRMLMDECKFHKVLFVFGNGFDHPMKAKFENMNTEYRAMLCRKDPRKIVWVRKVSHARVTYSVKGKVYSVDEMWGKYRSIQTMCVSDIGLIRKPDAVFFFPTSGTTRRSLQWCESRTKKNRVVLVGDIPLTF